MFCFFGIGRQLLGSLQRRVNTLTAVLQEQGSCFHRKDSLEDEKGSLQLDEDSLKKEAAEDIHLSESVQCISQFLRDQQNQLKRDISLFPSQKQGPGDEPSVEECSSTAANGGMPSWHVKNAADAESHGSPLSPSTQDEMHEEIDRRLGVGGGGGGGGQDTEFREGDNVSVEDFEQDTEHPVLKRTLLSLEEERASSAPSPPPVMRTLPSTRGSGAEASSSLLSRKDAELQGRTQQKAEQTGTSSNQETGQTPPRERDSDETRQQLHEAEVSVSEEGGKQEDALGSSVLEDKTGERNGERTSTTSASRAPVSKSKAEDYEADDEDAGVGGKLEEVRSPLPKESAVSSVLPGDRSEDSTQEGVTGGGSKPTGGDISTRTDKEKAFSCRGGVSEAVEVRLPPPEMGGVFRESELQEENLHAGLQQLQRQQQEQLEQLRLAEQRRQRLQEEQADWLREQKETLEELEQKLQRPRDRSARYTRQPRGGHSSRSESRKRGGSGSSSSGVVLMVPVDVVESLPRTTRSASAHLAASSWSWSGSSSSTQNRESHSSHANQRRVSFRQSHKDGGGSLSAAKSSQRNPHRGASGSHFYLLKSPRELLVKAASELERLQEKQRAAEQRRASPPVSQRPPPPAEEGSARRSCNNDLETAEVAEQGATVKDSSPGEGRTDHVCSKQSDRASSEKQEGKPDVDHDVSLCPSEATGDSEGPVASLEENSSSVSNTNDNEDQRASSMDKEVYAELVRSISQIAVQRPAVLSFHYERLPLSTTHAAACSTETPTATTHEEAAPVASEEPGTLGSFPASAALISKQSGGDWEPAGRTESEMEPDLTSSRAEGVPAGEEGVESSRLSSSESISAAADSKSTTGAPPRGASSKGGRVSAERTQPAGPVKRGNSQGSLLRSKTLRSGGTGQFGQQNCQRGGCSLEQRKDADDRDDDRALVNAKRRMRERKQGEQSRKQKSAGQDASPVRGDSQQGTESPGRPLSGHQQSKTVSSARQHRKQMQSDEASRTKGGRGALAQGKRKAATSSGIRRSASEAGESGAYAAEASTGRPPGLERLGSSRSGSPDQRHRGLLLHSSGTGGAWTTTRESPSGASVVRKAMPNATNQENRARLRLQSTAITGSQARTVAQSLGRSASVADLLRPGGGAKAKRSLLVSDVL